MNRNGTRQATKLYYGSPSKYIKDMQHHLAPIKSFYNCIEHIAYDLITLIFEGVVFFFR